MRSKSSSRALEQARVVAEACELRSKGYLLKEIGEQQGVTEKTAHVRVMKGLRISMERRDEMADLLFDQMLARLDELDRRLLDGVKSGDVSAIEAARKIAADRCKLLGLRAPKKIKVVDPEEAASQLKRLLGVEVSDGSGDST